ncbi:hypothetical protein pipiens_016205, partial [Culex pipiens pipiens]
MEILNDYLFSAS